MFLANHWLGRVVLGNVKHVLANHKSRYKIWFKHTKHAMIAILSLFFKRKWQFRWQYYLWRFKYDKSYPGEIIFKPILPYIRQI